MLGQGGEDAGQIVFPRQSMVARQPVVFAAEVFVVAEARCAPPLDPMPDAFGEDAGHEQRMIADVGADQERGGLVRGLERGHKVHKVLQRLPLARRPALQPFYPGKLRQHFGHVIRHGPILDTAVPQHVADEDVKIEMGRDAKAIPPLEEGVEQPIVVQDQIPARLIRQEPDQALRRGRLGMQHTQNELDVRGSELYPAVGLDHIHHFPSGICLPGGGSCFQFKVLRSRPADKPCCSTGFRYNLTPLLNQVNIKPINKTSAVESQNILKNLPRRFIHKLKM